jgi:hypothetical protein
MSIPKFITIENDNEVAQLVMPILGVISLFITAPLFIALHRFLPDPTWPYHVDRLGLALITLALVFFIFTKLKGLVITAFIATLCGLTITHYANRYSFEDMFTDYRNLLYSLKDSPYPHEYIAANFVPFPNKSSFLEGINYEHPDVRNFALNATRQHFFDQQERRKYRVIIQSMAVFKEINSQWSYVNDPVSREYIAQAQESVEHLAGDCDDHSILMAAAIKSIGGTPRLIYTKQHVYPELLIGSWADLEALNYLIREKLFKYEIGDKRLHYHQDQNNQIWLNLDYTADYPGGSFLQEDVLGVLTID